MAAQGLTGYGITTLWSAAEQGSEKSVLAGPRLADFLDRLPVKQRGNDLGAFGDARRAGNTGVPVRE